MNAAVFSTEFHVIGIDMGSTIEDWLPEIATGRVADFRPSLTKQRPRW